METNRRFSRGVNVGLGGRFSEESTTENCRNEFWSQSDRLCCDENGGAFCGASRKFAGGVYKRTVLWRVYNRCNEC